MPLRKYQEQAVSALARYWHKSRKPCIMQLSTGAGKSWVIADIVNKTRQPTLILQPTKEILEQNKDKLIASGVPEEDIAVCSASAGEWEIGKFTLATIGTIKKHYNLCQQFKIVIIDECDVVPVDNANSMYVKFLNRLPNARIVGLTATPWRNQVFQRRFQNPRVYCRPLTRIYMENGEKTIFGNWFWSGGIIFKCEIDYLQQGGYLLDTVYHTAVTDWSFVRDVPGRVDFDTDSMGRFMDIEANTSRFTQAINWCMENGLKTIVFSPNIDMSFRLKKVIESLGGTAETLDSENDSKATRKAKMSLLRNNKLQFLVNVGMVGRGVDVPSVDAVVLCRPTKSLSLYMQFVGRCLRVDPDDPGKPAYVIDLGGNVERFGKVEDVKLKKAEKTYPQGYKQELDVITITKEDKTKIWDLVE